MTVDSTETKVKSVVPESGQRRTGGVPPVLNLRVGDIVEVRSAAEILATLDDTGAFERTPFMPEMLQYCGMRFRVSRRADKTCDTISKTGIRRVWGAVHLENLRCDGGEHGGCEAGCLFYWKEAWLKRVSNDLVPAGGLNGGAPKRRCDFDVAIESLRGNAAKVTGPTPEDVVYSCQITRLLEYSVPLPAWDLRQYVRDVRSGNVAALTVLRSFLIWIFNRVQHMRGGRKIPGVKGMLEKKTPQELLDLQPGEMVEVKTKAEILATLDRNERNRGMSFDREMVKFCGRRVRVLRRVEKIINEKTGRMMRMKNDCIVLEGVTCEADYNRFCPRGIPPYWREIWLKRV